MSRPSENRGPREMAEFHQQHPEMVEGKYAIGAFRSCFMRNVCTATRRRKRLRFRRQSRWRLRGTRCWCRTYSRRWRQKFARRERRNVLLQCWIWPEIRAGAARRRRTAKTLTLVSRLGVAAIHGYQGSGPVPRQVARLCHGETFCGAWAAGSGHECGSGKLFGARHARIFLEAV